jgi:hypothetical protein
MGILDDLKQKADKARLEKEREEARLAELERIYRTGVRPAMLKIHGFLHEMVGLLADPVMASFEFPGIGRVGNLEQKGYNIQIDSQRDPKLVTLRFECVAKDEKRYAVSPKSAGEEACQFLTEQKVMFSDWAVRDANRQVSGLVIQCKLRVPVELAFEADIEKGGIRVVSHNYDGVAEKNFLAKHETIDAGWLDKLGYYILRQDDGFGTLSLSEDERVRIRTLVEEQRKQHDSLPADSRNGADAENGRGPKWLKLFNK